ncbi:MAG TPA: DUF302 domain-containing protein [Dehalococcoidia bacterium]|nr:DUF302 domain-containing protein [Dehalococcoidia bacterium]HLC30277.1 DUF302 domain-containing protein [Dehalococcoidia bacterium]
MALPVDSYAGITEKPLSAAVAAVIASAQAKGFRLLHVHDLQTLLLQQGLPGQPVAIVEICRARFGSEMLKADLRAALLMPCKVVVYTSNGKTYIEALRPRLLGDLLPDIAPLAEEEDALMRSIVDEASS